MASFDENYQADPEDAQKNKVMGILAYFGCLCFLPLIAAKDSQFARFHANQGITLFIVWIALSVAEIALNFTGIPMIGWVITIARLCALVLMVLGIVSAAKGEMKPLPVVGGITILK